MYLCIYVCVYGWMDGCKELTSTVTIFLQAEPSWSGWNLHVTLLEGPCPTLGGPGRLKIKISWTHPGYLEQELQNHKSCILSTRRYCENWHRAAIRHRPLAWWWLDSKNGWMYLCMHGWMDVWMYGCMRVCVYGCMYVRTYVRMYVCVYVYMCMCVCMCICMCLHIYIHIYIYYIYTCKCIDVWGMAIPTIIHGYKRMFHN